MRAVAGVIALAGLGGLVFVVLRMGAAGSGESLAGQAIREDLGLPEPESPAAKKDRETIKRGEAQEKYTPTEAEVLAGLVNLGRARWEDYGEWANAGRWLGVERLQSEYGRGGKPIRSTRNSTDADRQLLAEVECRRAVDHYGMPSGQLAQCMTTVSGNKRQTAPIPFGGHGPNEHAYTLPGGRKWTVGI